MKKLLLEFAQLEGRLEGRVQVKFKERKEAGLKEETSELSLKDKEESG